MNIEQFEVFRTIVQARSFTKAAKILNFTQPAISSQIKLLERNFNTALCERGNNGVKLTQAGKIFYEYGDKILILQAEMEDEIAKLTGQQKEFINVGASYSVGNYSLPSSIITFKEIYPSVHVRLDIGPTAEILQKLHNRQIDIAIVEGNIVDTIGLDIFKIDSNKVVLIVPPKGKWLDIDSITIGDLTKEPFIAREEESSIRNFTDSYLKSSGYGYKNFNIVMEITNFDAIKFAVMRNKGVSLVPYPIAQKEIAEGSLKMVEVVDLNMEWEIKIACRTNESLTGLKEIFLNFISTPNTKSFRP